MPATLENSCASVRYASSVRLRPMMASEERSFDVD
jgi:hypothetical protein